MKKLFLALFLTSAFAATPVASAVTLDVYANPHDNGKNGNGAGASLSGNVSGNFIASVNYLDTNRVAGRDRIIDARVGYVAKIMNGVSGIAEGGIGRAHLDDRNVFPVALAIRYQPTDRLSLLVKANRYFKHEHGEARKDQFTVGVGLSF